MTQPIRPVPDLDEIRGRRDKAKRWYGGVHHGHQLYADSSADVPALLAEVVRLRAGEPWETVELRAEIKRLREHVTTLEGAVDGSRISCGQWEKLAADHMLKYEARETYVTQVERELAEASAEIERLRSGQPWEELFRQRDEAIAERDRLRAETAEAREILLAYRADDTHAAGDLTALPLVELAKVRAKDLVVSDNELDRTTALYRDLLREARAERDRLRDRVTEAEAVIVRASDALGVDHPVWVILDDYDGSMDSVHALVRERDEAIAERDRYAEVIQAARLVHAASAGFFHDGPAHVPADELVLLIAAVDRLGDDDG